MHVPSMRRLREVRYFDIARQFGPRRALIFLLEKLDTLLDT